MYIYHIGATKAKISAHFAVKDRLSDVIAKESTQETAVGLIGMMLGAICTKLIGSDLISNWVVFTALLLLHQWANYNLIKVLILNSINPQRAMILTQELILIRQQKNSHQGKCDNKKSSNDSSFNSILSFNINEQLMRLSPSAISRSENLYRPIYLSFMGPQVGYSLKSILDTLNYCTMGNDTIKIWKDLQQCWHDEKFIIGYDTNDRVCACLQEGSNEADEVKAYFISCYLHCIRTQISSVLKFTLCSKFDKGKALQAKYHNLLHNDAKESLNWFNNCFDVKSHTDMSVTNLSTSSRDLFQVLSLCNWDGVSSGKSRLGSESWRYQCEENKKDR
jgi:hypothetical protein